MAARMKLVVPLTLLIILMLLFLQFRNVIEVHHPAVKRSRSRSSAASGDVAPRLPGVDGGLGRDHWLVGLAAQTGIVMIVYIDNAFHKRQAEGRIND